MGPQFHHLLFIFLISLKIVSLCNVTFRPQQTTATVKTFTQKLEKNSKKSLYKKYVPTYKYNELHRPFILLYCIIILILTLKKI